MNRIKMWIMYHEKDVEKNRWFIDTFIKMAEKYNIDMCLVTVEAYDRKEINADGVNGVVARMINPRVSYELEKSNVCVFNSAQVSFICNNKAESIRHISACNVKCIPTLIAKKLKNGKIHFDMNCYYNNEFDEILDCILESKRFPMTDKYIIKSVCGHGGREVLTLSEYVSMYGDSLENSLSFGIQEKNAADFYDDRYIIQPVIKNEGDVRVYTIGGEIIAAVKRKGNNSFKSNYSLGGNVELYELNEKEKKTVKTILKSIDADYAGIDFLLVDGEFVFNEIEDVVGARMLSACSDIDYINLYIKYINNSLNTVQL